MVNHNDKWGGTSGGDEVRDAMIRSLIFLVVSGSDGASYAKLEEYKASNGVDYLVRKNYAEKIDPKKEIGSPNYRLTDKGRNLAERVRDVVKEDLL